MSIKMKASRRRVVVVAVALAASTGCASDATRFTGETAADTSAPVGVDDTDASDTTTDGTPAGDPDQTSASDPQANAAPATPAPSAVVDVEVQPGLADDGFVGARGDVIVERCESSESGDSSAVNVFVAEGEVTNSTESDAAYRIYVAFNPPDSTVSRGLIQIDDILVSAGESAPWSAELATDDSDLTCILRVERVSAP